MGRQIVYNSVLWVTIYHVLRTTALKHFKQITFVKVQNKNEDSSLSKKEGINIDLVQFFGHKTNPKQ